MFSPGFVELPRVGGVHSLVRESQHKLGFAKGSGLRVAQFVEDSIGSMKIQGMAGLLALLRLVTASARCRLLTSIKFAGSMGSRSFREFGGMCGFLIGGFTASVELRRISALIKLAPATFYHCFGREAGGAFMRCLGRVHVNCSGGLLLRGGVGVSAVDKRIKFPGLSGFVSRFGGIAKVSPSRFRGRFKMGTGRTV